MKKRVSVLLIIAVLLSVFTTSYSEGENSDRVVAIERPKGGLLITQDIRERDADSNISLFGTPSWKLESITVPEKPIEQYLTEKILDREEEIPIYEAGYRYSFSEFAHIFNTMLFNNYELMVFSHELVSYISDGAGGNKVYEFYPDYMFSTRQEDDDARQLMAQEIEQYLDAAEDVPNDDIVGKMLIIHDLFCKTNTYAVAELEQEEQTGVSNSYIRTPHCLFRYKKAVCQGYAIALNAIYRALNENLKQDLGVSEDIIQTALIASEGVDHMWNAVKLDGQWYYMDVTFDDAITGQVSDYCLHSYFMVPESIIEYDHIDPDYGFDWDYYSLYPLAREDFSDDKYLTGYIFSGWYHYDGYLVDTYYGNISYENGMYKVIVDAKPQYEEENDRFVLTGYGYHRPFWSPSLISDGIIATEPYNATAQGEPCKQTVLFTLEETHPMQLHFLQYDSNGLKYYTINNRGGLSELTMAALQHPTTLECKLLIWEHGSIKPLCRPIEIPLYITE